MVTVTCASSSVGPSIDSAGHHVSHHAGRPQEAAKLIQHRGFDFGRLYARRPGRPGLLPVLPCR